MTKASNGKHRASRLVISPESRGLTLFLIHKLPRPSLPVTLPSHHHGSLLLSLPLLDSPALYNTTTTTLPSSSPLHTATSIFSSTFFHAPLRCNCFSFSTPQLPPLFLLRCAPAAVHPSSPLIINKHLLQVLSCFNLKVLSFNYT